MAEYQLTATEEPCSVIREIDGACIPPDMANRDYNGDAMQPGYVQWKEAGGVPDPYVPPDPVAMTPTPEQQILYDHENRVRALEGQPPLGVVDFVARLQGNAPPQTPQPKARRR
jgi:hypothetical protein